ncbi:MAG: 3-deoxy-manno-octulosonate cytidylyltransferase, partial [Paramuribaculum sp.]
VEQWPAAASLHLHVGLYAFRRSLLPDIAALPSCPLEKAERLEQLRWLAAGYRIRIAMTESRTISVDTPADLENARRFASAHDHLKHPLP